MIARKVLREGVEWKGMTRGFQAHSKHVFEWFGKSMVVKPDAELKKRLKLLNDATVNVWIIEEGDDVAVLGINVNAVENDPRVWNWALISTSSEIADQVMETIHANAGSEDDSDEEESDDEEEESQEWNDDMIVDTHSEGIVYLVETDHEPYKAVNVRGFVISVDPEDIDTEADSDDAQSAIEEAFELSYDNGDGWEIRRWVGEGPNQGKLVKVESVDGSDFTIEVDGNTLSLGEDVDVSKLSYDGVFQPGEDVKVHVGPGEDDFVYGEIVNLSSDYTYDITFSEEQAVHESKVLPS